MSLKHGGSIVRDGLYLYIDMANPKSIPADEMVDSTRITDAATITDLAGNYNCTMGTDANGIWVAENSGMFDIDYVSTANEVKLPSSLATDHAGDTNFTLSFWAQLDSVSADIDTLYTGSGGNANLFIYRTPSTRWAFFQYDGAVEHIFLNSSHAETGITIGVPFNITVVAPYNPPNEVGLYVNGNFISSTTETTPQLAFTAGQMGIGQEYDGGTKDANQRWHGKFASLAMYNRALSATEIKQNFLAMRGRFGL